MQRIPINPQQLGAPKGYANGVLVRGGADLLFVAGQIGWNADQQLVSERFVEQFAAALGNVLCVVTAAGGDAAAIVRLTVYVTDKREYLADLKAIGQVWREHMGRHYPAMALVEVRDLLEPGAKVEIEATAAIAPHEDRR